MSTGMTFPGRTARWSAMASLVALGMLASGVASAAFPSEHTRARLLASDRVTPALLAALEKRERVPVVIGLVLPTFSAAPTDAPARRAAVRAAIHDMGEATLQRFDPGDFTLRFRFGSVAALAGDITAGGLAKLLGDPNVWQVDLDRELRPLMSEAGPLARFDRVQSFGVTGKGVTVAVLDTGIDRTHPDLSDDVVGEECFCIAFNLAPCCPNGSSRQSGPGSAADSSGHGTRVSGIITGKGQVAPIGGAPDAGILAIRVAAKLPLHPFASGIMSGAIAALDWIYDNRPDVGIVNMSFGLVEPLGPDMLGPLCDDANPTTRAFAEAMGNLRGRGVPVFVATGDVGSLQGMNIPACVSHAIRVGATWDTANPDYNLLGPPPPGFEYAFCNFPRPAIDAAYCYTNAPPGAWGLDLVAPGALITSTDRGGGVATGLGTSFATALASACAAVLLEEAPHLRARDIELALENAPRIVDERTGQSYPRLNCLDALGQVSSSGGLCTLQPRSGCRRVTAPKKSKIDIKNYDSDTRDRLTWFWTKGTATAEADFGNPLTTGDHSLCVYQSAFPYLMMASYIPPGGSCAGRPCWERRTSTTGPYFKYRDRLQSPSGIDRAYLYPRSTGSALIRAYGKGPNLGVPQLPLVAPVTVQLVNHRTNVCWEGVYGTPSTNTAARFKAYSE